MRDFLITLLLLLLLCGSLTALEVNPDNSLRINGISFNLNPEVNIRTATNIALPLTFVKSVADYSDSIVIVHSNPSLDLAFCIKPLDSFFKTGWQITVRACYKQDVFLSDLALNLEYPGSIQVVTYKGPQAINSRQQNDNQDLCPFTDKMMEVATAAGSLWIVGSNYAGCSGIEWIKQNSIRLYDRTLHFARLYNTTVFTTLIDTLPRHEGQNDVWSFLIFEQQPYLLTLNRWPQGKRAALAITNDADHESLKKLQAVYYGSSNPESRNYLTKGLIANGIRVSNTVFGGNLDGLGAIWNELKNKGNTIGYHTYSSVADYASVIEANLLHQMSDYNIRLWIDHGWSTNPEDFCMSGWDSSTPYYILDIINQSSIKYAWAGDLPLTNPINAFSDPWRLPHRLYEFENLTRPVWFFGRTRMEAWEYLNQNYYWDLKHNLTAENLDKLIEDNGLCIIYTHFGFNQEGFVSAYFNILNNGDYEIKEEVNDRLRLLNNYQVNCGLWIAPVEEIFDRMLAIEQVQIVQVEDYLVPGFVKVTLENKSDFTLADLSFNYGTASYSIPAFAPNSQYSIIVSKYDPPSINDSILPYQVFLIGGNVIIKSRESQFIPPMTVRIYNLKGQLVASQNLASQANFLSIPFVGKASGVYFARIESEGSKSQVIRFTRLR